nr:Gag-Pol polyprotein [Tanacetum cinerariifolium]
TASEEDSDPKQAQRDKDMQKNLALIAKYFKKIYKPTNKNLRTSLNSRNKNVDTTPRENVGSLVVQQYGIQCFNYKFGHSAKERKKPKRGKDFAYHKEKMLLCKQAEKGVSLQVEQYHWPEDTNEEIDGQELEAHYSYMAKIQEVPIADSGTDSELLEQERKKPKREDTNEEIDGQELEAHYSYMAKIQEVPIADSGTDSELLEQNDQNDVESDDEHVTLAILKLDTEFEKYKAFNDYTVDYDKLEHIVDNAWIKHSKNQFRAPTAQDMEILIQTCLMPLAFKTQNDSFIFVHELKQEMHVDLKYVESIEKEIGELESDKTEFSNMYDMILQECVSNDVMCSYLLSLSDLCALAELQCLYLHKVKELEKHLISLEIAWQKCKEQVKNDTAWNEQASNVFQKECEQYIKIQDLKAQLQDKNIAISELKKLIHKGKGKSVETNFDKPSIVRQPNAQQIPKPSVLVDAHVPSQQELDLLCGPLYDEFFNAGSNPQATKPTTNIQPTSAPSTPTYVHAEENNDNQAEEEHLPNDEFTNPFCTPTQEVAESSSHNIDHEMYMFALTVSTAEPKNIKEAMADSAWIEAVQEELHQFDRLQVWELVDKPFGKSVIRLKWLWKNKKDEDQTVIRNKA